MNTITAKSIMHSVGFRLLQEKIAVNGHILNRIIVETESIGLSLSTSLLETDMECVMNLCNRSYMNEFYCCTTRQ